MVPAVNDDAETLPGLLASSSSAGRQESEDFTPLHEELPSNVPREPSLHGPRDQGSAVSRLQRGHLAALAYQLDNRFSDGVGLAWLAR